jgi:hypothetical protein
MNDKLDADETFSMIVQLPLSSFWGRESELAARDGLADAFDRLFAESELGKFDGTDCGSGTTNLFIYCIAPPNWERAVELVLTELRRQNLAERAIIVKSIWVEERDSCEWTVVWPRDFQGIFRL